MAVAKQLVTRMLRSFCGAIERFMLFVDFAILQQFWGKPGAGGLQRGSFMGCCNPGHCGTEPGIYDQWAMVQIRVKVKTTGIAQPAPPTERFLSVYAKPIKKR